MDQENNKKMHNQCNQGLCFLFEFTVRGKLMPTYIFGADSTNPTGSTICGLSEHNRNALWEDNGLVKLLQERGYITAPSSMYDPEL
jgi:hypothetical protein